MAAGRTILCFFLPLAVVIGTVSSAHLNTRREASEENGSLERSCPPEEQFSRCNAGCQRNCTNINENPGICPTVCKPGCVCKGGLVRDHRGRCIPRKDCSEETSSFCPENEEYSKSKAHCQKNCSNWNAEISCLELYVPGCICKEGYVRGPRGRCILIKTCPLKPQSRSDKQEFVCPPHEKYSNCEAHCQKNCTNFEGHFPCTKTCIGGCVCEEGLVRGPKGNCILPKKCPPKPEAEQENLPDVLGICKENELWSVCPSTCPDNCTNYMEKYRWCVIFCIPGCVCKKGYVKGPEGNCIVSDKCPRKKRPDECTELEEFKPRGTPCEDTCKNYKDDNRKCDDKRFIPGCFCKPGYIRNETNGACIFPFDCPKQSSISEVSQSDHLDEETITTDESNKYDVNLFCKKNEEWSLTASICPDDCQNYKDWLRPCLLIKIPGCICKKGYVKGPDGICITPDKCKKEEKIPDNCTKEEYYDTCGTCEDDCKNWNSGSKSCAQECKRGCFCLKGRVRSPSGECIWPFDCPDAKDKSYQPLNELSEIEEPSVDEVSEGSVSGVLGTGGCPDERLCLKFCRKIGMKYGHCGYGYECICNN